MILHSIKNIMICSNPSFSPHLKKDCLFSQGTYQRGHVLRAPNWVDRPKMLPDDWRPLAPADFLTLTFKVGIQFATQFWKGSERKVDSPLLGTPPSTKWESHCGRRTRYCSTAVVYGIVLFHGCSELRWHSVRRAVACESMRHWPAEMTAGWAVERGFRRFGCWRLLSAASEFVDRRPFVSASSNSTVRSTSHLHFYARTCVPLRSYRGMNQWKVLFELAPKTIKFATTGHYLPQSTPTWTKTFLTHFSFFHSSFFKNIVPALSGIYTLFVLSWLSFFLSCFNDSCNKISQFDVFSRK